MHLFAKSQSQFKHILSRFFKVPPSARCTVTHQSEFRASSPTVLCHQPLLLSFLLHNLGLHLQPLVCHWILTPQSSVQPDPHYPLSLIYKQSVFISAYLVLLGVSRMFLCPSWATGSPAHLAGLCSSLSGPLSQAELASSSQLHPPPFVPLLLSL